MTTKRPPLRVCIVVFCSDGHLHASRTSTVQLLTNSAIYYRFHINHFNIVLTYTRVGGRRTNNNTRVSRLPRQTIADDHSAIVDDSSPSGQLLTYTLISQTSRPSVTLVENETRNAKCAKSVSAKILDNDSGLWHWGERTNKHFSNTWMMMTRYIRGSPANTLGAVRINIILNVRQRESQSNKINFNCRLALILSSCLAFDFTC